MNKYITMKDFINKNQKYEITKEDLKLAFREIWFANNHKGVCQLKTTLTKKWVSGKDQKLVSLERDPSNYRIKKDKKEDLNLPYLPILNCPIIEDLALDHCMGYENDDLKYKFWVFAGDKDGVEIRGPSMIGTYEIARICAIAYWNALMITYFNTDYEKN